MYYEYRYRNVDFISFPAPDFPEPNYSDPAPSGWNTNPTPTTSSFPFCWMIVAKKKADGTMIGIWSNPTRLTGLTGSRGATGATGSSPALVYRGDYSSTTIYYGTANRVDAVKYNSVYYVARVDAGNGFTNVLPTNTTYWNSFGSSFESVATKLLLAENANIAGWIFKNQGLESQDGKAFLNGTNGELTLGTAYSGHSVKTVIKPDASNNTSCVEFYQYVNGYGTRLVGEIRINQSGMPGACGISFHPMDEYGMPTLYSHFGDDLYMSNGGSNEIIIKTLNRSNGCVVLFKELPTSPSGLDSGQVWRDGTNLKIVPYV
jgi:hypothetical protein